MHNSLQAFGRIVDGTTKSSIQFFNLPQGFTCLLKTRCQPHIKSAIKNLDAIWGKSAKQVARDIVGTGKLSLTEINHLLYRCVNEENDISSNERGPYGLPSSG